MILRLAILLSQCSLSSALVNSVGLGAGVGVSKRASAASMLVGHQAYDLNNEVVTFVFDEEGNAQKLETGFFTGLVTPTSISKAPFKAPFKAAVSSTAVSLRGALAKLQAKRRLMRLKREGEATIAHRERMQAACAALSKPAVLEKAKEEEEEEEEEIVVSWYDQGVRLTSATALTLPPSLALTLPATLATNLDEEVVTYALDETTGQAKALSAGYLLGKVVPTLYYTATASQQQLSRLQDRKTRFRTFASSIITALPSSIALPGSIAGPASITKQVVKAALNKLRFSWATLRLSAALRAACIAEDLTEADIQSAAAEREVEAWQGSYAMRCSLKSAEVREPSASPSASSDASLDSAVSLTHTAAAPCLTRCTAAVRTQWTHSDTHTPARAVRAACTVLSGVGALDSRE